MASLEMLSDRLEIDDLLIRYTTAIDDKNWDLLDEVFTPDAHIDYVSSGGIAGPYPEVKAWLAKVLSSFTICVHAISNSRIELAGDCAQGRTLVISPNGIPMPDGSIRRITVGAYYHDELVRTNQGWRIASRREEQLFMDQHSQESPEVPGS